MPEYIFTIDITETWIKKVKIIAKDRTEAIAKARADFISMSQKNTEYSLSRDPEAKIRDIDIKLEFPNGNPYEVFGDGGIEDG